MNKKLSVLTILLPLAILGAILPAQVIPRAHAAGNGLVCIAQVTDTKCPFPTGPTFNGPFTTPNSLLRVPVMINNTDPFNGFDITLNSSDLSKLKPWGADLIGSIMPTGSVILANCAGGVLISGSTCAPPNNNPSTVELAVVGPFGFLAPQGTTGILFTAIFSIAGTTSPGGVKINYQNGCPTSSVAGTGKICVTLQAGTINAVPEATQNGGFDNSNTATLPYATLSTTTTNLGQSLAGAPTRVLLTSTFTATSRNMFNTSSTPTLTLATSVNGTGIRPTVSLSTNSITLNGLPQSFTQTGSVSSTVPAGVYIATVTATYQTQDTLTFATISSLSAAYPLPINVTDYVVSASPNPVKILPPGSQPVTVTITPKGGFNGLVNLYVTIPAATSSASISATYSSSTISGSGTSTLTITSTASTPFGTFTVTILSNTTFSGFTKSRATTLTIQVTGFTVTATSPGSQTVGTAESSTIKVSFISGFTGIVALTNNTVVNLSCLTISPASFSKNGTTTVQCSSLVAGSYSLIILATSGSRTIAVAVTFTFTFHDVAISSFTISPSAQAPVGTKISVVVQLQNKGGVDESVLVALLVDSQTIPPTQNVTVRANSNLPVTLYWDSTKSTARTYNITISIQLSLGEINAESSQQILSKNLGTYSLQPVSGSPTLDTTTIAIIAGVVVAVASAGTALIFRSRRKPSNGAQAGTL